MPKLFSQMEAVSHRFEELSIRLNQPETAADPALFRRLMQEYHELEPVVDAYRKLATAKDHLEQAKALLEGETLDADFKEMVQQEVSEKSQDVAELENNLKILLLPKDANDEKSVILELRGGAGGEEAALFAHSLMRMYSMYVQSRGWEWEVLNLNETELGGVKEAIIAVNGRGAYNRLKYESGVHRVQRVPETETQGRIHTSTATVAVMPQAEEVDFALDMKDLRIDTFRSSGAGGQHINKTSSAIRVTHLPTGMVVECQNERSQFQNKDKALEILRSRLLAQKQKEQQDAINANRQGQVGTGDRSEKIRTYNFPQDRCTDHRIGLTVHNLDKIMDGNLDEIIDALAMREQAEKLRQLDTQSDRLYARNGVKKLYFTVEKSDDLYENKNGTSPGGCGRHRPRRRASAAGRAGGSPYGNGVRHCSRRPQRGSRQKNLCGKGTPAGQPPHRPHCRPGHAARPCQ